MRLNRQQWTRHHLAQTYDLTFRSLDQLVGGGVCRPRPRPVSWPWIGSRSVFDVLVVAPKLIAGR